MAHCLSNRPVNRQTYMQAYRQQTDRQQTNMQTDRQTKKNLEFIFSLLWLLLLMFSFLFFFYLKTHFQYISTVIFNIFFIMFCTRGGFIRSVGFPLFFRQVTQNRRNVDADYICDNSRGLLSLRTMRKRVPFSSVSTSEWSDTVWGRRWVLSGGGELGLLNAGVMESGAHWMKCFQDVVTCKWERAKWLKEISCWNKRRKGFCKVFLKLEQKDFSILMLRSFPNTNFSLSRCSHAFFVLFFCCVSDITFAE